MFVYCCLCRCVLLSLGLCVFCGYNCTTIQNCHIYTIVATCVCCRCGHTMPCCCPWGCACWLWWSACCTWRMLPSSCHRHACRLTPMYPPSVPLAPLRLAGLGVLSGLLTGLGVSDTRSSLVPVGEQRRNRCGPTIKRTSIALQQASPSWIGQSSKCSTA